MNTTASSSAGSRFPEAAEGVLRSQEAVAGRAEQHRTEPARLIWWHGRAWHATAHTVAAIHRLCEWPDPAYPAARFIEREIADGHITPATI